MEKNRSIWYLIACLWGHISLRRKKQFFLLLILMMVASIAEIVSIGSVIPFLGALTAPQKIFEAPVAQPLISFLQIHDSSQLIIPVTVLFCFAALSSAGIRLILLTVSTRLSFSAGADLGVDIYQKTLYQPYRVHVSRNSSEIINGISNKANVMIYSIILPVLTLIISCVMLLAILLVLICISPIVSMGAALVFIFVYVILAKLTRAKKIKNSRIVANQSTQIIKSLQEGLGGIRDVLIDGSQKIYCDAYKNADRPLRSAQASNQIASLSPRYIMESLGMVLIAGIAFYLFEQSNGVQSAIPVLGILALGAQRMLPVMQQAYVAWSSIQGSYASLQDTLALLEQPLPPSFNGISLKIDFNNEIKLQDVNFKYDSLDRHVISKLNFSIFKGDRIGIIGNTGGGKSTLIDILMGLLQPTSGTLSVDGVVIDEENVRGWQNHIAHVPQAIFLSDASIAENIAFGVDKKDINFDRVREAAKKAELDSVIANLPDEYNAFVGERGIRLSGGQRQRIGIARALYKKADVFIFDEATSALDSRTEDSIIQSIESLGEEITVVMIAHRLTTLRSCKKIIEVADGQIINVGNYEQIINRNV